MSGSEAQSSKCLISEPTPQGVSQVGASQSSTSKFAKKSIVQQSMFSLSSSLSVKSVSHVRPSKGTLGLFKPAPVAVSKNRTQVHLNALMDSTKERKVVITTKQKPRITQEDMEILNQHRTQFHEDQYTDFKISFDDRVAINHGAKNVKAASDNRVGIWASILKPSNMIGDDIYSMDYLSV